MRLRPPISTRTDTLLPNTTLFRSMPRSPARSGRLRHRGTCGPTGALHLAAMLIYPCLAQARHARKDLKHGGADGSGGAMSIELQTEIGRASCRERVCQSV